MQYQCNLDSDGLINLATKQYFGNVDQKNLDQTLACFHEDAALTVQTAFTRHGGKPQIRQMFETFFASYETIIHRDFRCTVDVPNGRIVARFIAELIDADGQTTLLENTNFWRVNGRQFQDVYVYMSGENVLV